MIYLKDFINESLLDIDDADTNLTSSMSDYILNEIYFKVGTDKKTIVFSPPYVNDYEGYTVADRTITFGAGPHGSDYMMDYNI